MNIKEILEIATETQLICDCLNNGMDLVFIDYEDMEIDEWPSLNDWRKPDVVADYTSRTGKGIGSVGWYLLDVPNGELVEVYDCMSEYYCIVPYFKDFEEIAHIFQGFDFQRMPTNLDEAYADLIRAVKAYAEVEAC